MSELNSSPAPELQVSEWVQGGPFKLKDFQDKILVIEVFQVNCPGCFLYGLPEAIEVYNTYQNKGVEVIGIATAFEDYDMNNIANLKILIDKCETIGETLRTLKLQGILIKGNKLPYKIPFPVAMDLLEQEQKPVNDERLMKFIKSNVTDFDLYHPRDKGQIVKRATQYLQSKPYSAITFEEYSLKGTPSTIYIDKKGNVRQTTFGSTGTMKYIIDNLLLES